MIQQLSHVGRKPRVRLLHTSDLHLGTDIGVRGTAWHGVNCACPLAAVARLAEKERCDLLLIAGDLFDHNRVRDPVVDAALVVLGALPMPCVIVPGNHDAYDGTSVYRRVDFQGRAPQVRVVSSEDGLLIRFAQLSMTIWAKPVVVHDTANRPLGGAPAHPGEGWYVVAAHGQFTGHLCHAGEPPASPIFPWELDAIEANYVALGHEDVTRPVNNGGPLTWYSGAPHLGGAAASALIVTLDVASGVLVEERRVSVSEDGCPSLGTSA